MSTEIWIALIGAILTTISVVAGVAALFVRLGRWGQRLENQISAVDQRLGSRIDTLNNWARGFSREVSAYLGLIVQLMNRRGTLSNEELATVLQRQAALGYAAVDALFEQERRSGNPLTQEEWQRLRGYVDKARAGQLFTVEEVEDYNRLVAILEREKPADPGVWPLVALGAFLLGLYLGTKKQDRGAAERAS